MKPSPSNFIKIRNYTLDEWKGFSAYKKKTYWDLHVSYPEENLLTHIQNGLNITDDDIDVIVKKDNLEKKRAYKSKKTTEKVVVDPVVSESKIDEIARLQIEVNDTKINTLFTQYNKHEIIITTSETRITNLEHDKKDVSKKYRSLKKISTKLINDNIELKNDVKELKNGLNILTSLMNKSYEQMDALKEEIKTMKKLYDEQVDRYESEIKKKDDKIKDLTRENYMLQLQVRAEQPLHIGLY